MVEVTFVVNIKIHCIGNMGFSKRKNFLRLNGELKLCEDFSKCNIGVECVDMERIKNLWYHSSIP